MGVVRLDMIYVWMWIFVLSLINFCGICTSLLGYLGTMYRCTRVGQEIGKMNHTDKFCDPQLLECLNQELEL